jgi:hypothetical protein
LIDEKRGCGVLRVLSLFAGISLATALGGCSYFGTPGADNATAVAAVKGAEVNCVKPQVVTMLRDKIFDEAIASTKEATQNLNNLRVALVGRIEAPLLQGHDATLKRTQCAGKLVFSLPPSVIKAFDGATALSADINYAVQPAADKSGLVVEADGTTPIVDALVTATQKKRIVRVKIPNPSAPIAAGAPRIDMASGDIFGDLAPSRPLPPEPKPTPVDLGPATVRPSFGCKGNLNRVERMICSDTMLADQDRTLASTYKAARSRAPVAQVGQLESVRTRYLSRRNSCGDAMCVSAVYDDWIAATADWQPSDGQ